MAGLRRTADRLQTRWGQFRGVHEPDQPSDFDEYHVQRNGVDLDAIVDVLQPDFAAVQHQEDWTTQAYLLPPLGERLGFTTTFSVLAAGGLTSRR